MHPSVRAFRFSAALPLLAAMLFSAPLRAQDKAPVNAGPYVPSPTSVVADMLALANVGPKDFVIDLGSGDGRIVLTAAKVFGASGFGVDINPKLVKEANESAQQQGIADRASFTIQDLFKTDIRKATVLTMYLLPNTVNMLKDKLLAELNPGTRILSHDYPLSGWIADDVKEFELEDKIAITGVPRTILYLYKVPARVEGEWLATVPAAISRQPIALKLSTQRVTRLTGTARIAGRNVVIDEGIIRGEQVRFKFFVGERNYEFSGTARDGRMEGTVEGRGVKAAWSAALAK
jgi:hypothetical protein